MKIIRFFVISSAVLIAFFPIISQAIGWSDEAVLESARIVSNSLRESRVSYREESQTKAAQNIVHLIDKGQPLYGRADLLVRGLERFLYQHYISTVPQGIPDKSDLVEAAAKALVSLVQRNEMAGVNMASPDSRLVHYFITERADFNSKKVDYSGMRYLRYLLSRHLITESQLETLVSRRNDELRVAFSYVKNELLDSLQKRILLRPNFYSKFNLNSRIQIAISLLSRSHHWQNEETEGLEDLDNRIAETVATLLRDANDEVKRDIVKFINSNREKKRGVKLARLALKKIAAKQKAETILTSPCINVVANLQAALFQLPAGSSRK